MDWREFFETVEVADAKPYAADLFKRAFGHDAPGYPRHFVLLYGARGNAANCRTVAYVHQLAYNEVFLAGGMFVDERSYRVLSRDLYAAIRNEGGFGTIVLRESISMLGDSPACFAHVGEPRSRQAVLRTGFVDTGEPHLMVYWRKNLDETERKALVKAVAAHGPF